MESLRRTLDNPLTYILLVWGVSFVVIGMCLALSD